MHTVMPKTVQFDIYTLDLQCCSLLRGRDEIRLRRKSFDVLRYLAEHAGRVVSKEELIHVIWPDLFVTDDSVVQCIADIRAALHDDAHRIIKTVPRRGYFFAAERSGKEVDEQRPPVAAWSRDHILSDQRWRKSCDGVRRAGNAPGEHSHLAHPS